VSSRAGAEITIAQPDAGPGKASPTIMGSSGVGRYALSLCKSRLSARSPLMRAMTAFLKGT